jgi:hypothetical protein
VLDPRAQAFRESFVAAAIAARTNGRPSTRSIAGDAVRLTFVDDALAARLLPAFEHLGRTSEPPDLELIAWTDVSSADPPWVLPWGPGHVGPRGGVHGLLEGPVRSSAAHDGSSLTLWDADRRICACWWRDVGSLRAWDDAAPLRLALHFALRREDRMLIHAACVGAAGDGVLLAGPGGSGKSTTTAACLRAGLQAVGDDYAVLDTARPEPRAHTIYRSLKTTTALGQRDARAVDGGRQTLMIGEDVPGATASSLRIVAVMVPRVVDAPRSSAVAIKPAQALRAILPSTLLQAPRESSQEFRPVLDLVSSVPCFELLLGADRGVPPIVRILTELST